jgi:hypothetical protein
MASNTTKRYRVTRVIIVDRPELRDESFAPVAPGTRVVYAQEYTSYNRAVSEFNRAAGGEEDFAPRDPQAGRAHSCTDRDPQAGDDAQPRSPVCAARRAVLPYPRHEDGVTWTTTCQEP